MSVAAEVIRPASETSTVELGSPRFVWLKALKFSHRNSRVLPSVITKFLDSDRLNRYWGGPRSEPFDDVPLRKGRSEEHTSELQSRENLVCRLLLETNK